MIKRILFISALWFAATTVSSGQYNAFGTNRTITVSGSAQVKVAPDQVELLLGVESFDASLQTAKHDNDVKMNRVIAALKAEKIDTRFIQTDTVAIQPHYWNNNSSSQAAPPKLTHYTVRRNVNIVLTNVAQFERVLSAALESGANYVQNISFKSSDLRKHRDQARAMAIRAAKEKAVALARELQMKVGKPITINEGGGGYFGSYRNYAANAMYQAQNSVAIEGESNSEVVQGTFSPGQITIDANVSVVFDLE